MRGAVLVLVDEATRKKTKLRFWTKVDTSAGPDGCWLWEASGQFGYGHFRFMGKGMLAHRVSYALHHGYVPKSSKCVLHSCDNPTCVNPRHLFLGTRKVNNRDKENKGRGNHPVGAANGMTKLKEDDVKWIRYLYWRCSVTQQEIADRFCVSTCPVFQIIHYKTWRHVV